MTSLLEGNEPDQIPTDIENTVRYWNILQNIAIYWINKSNWLHIVQFFKTVVDDFNLVEGQNRGLHLDYHILSSVVDSVVYKLEITILSTKEKVSLPCYILPEDDPKSQLLRTLELLNKFVKLTENEK